MKTMNKTYSPNKTTEKLMKKQLYKPANNITSQTYKTKFNQLFTKINTKMEEITMTKNINNKHTLNFVQQYNFKIIVTPNNYPERNIKNTPIEEINTRNHYSLANKPLQQEIKPVKCNTSTVKQRALRITKTEVSRAQNTAILQTYANEGYTEVTILTAEDPYVCRLCLANAYQFNKDSEMVYHEDLKDRTHRISDLDEDSLLPLHPNCYMPDTQIYTKEGWKYVSEITLNDNILSLNPETDTVEFIKPVNYIDHMNASGKMYHIHNKWFDTCVTPEHDCFIHQRKMVNGKRQLVPEFRKPHELNSESRFLRTISNNNISPETININGLELETNDYVFLLAWYLSEGSVLHDEKESIKRNHPIKISQEIPENRRILTREFKQMQEKYDLTIYYGAAYYEIHDKRLRDYFLQFGYSHEKYLPQELLELSRDHLNMFLSFYLSGDGHVRRHGKYNSIEANIFTSSTRLRDDISYLILLAGHYPSIALHTKKGTVQEHHNGNYIQNMMYGGYQ